MLKMLLIDNYSEKLSALNLKEIIHIHCFHVIRNYYDNQNENINEVRISRSCNLTFINIIIL